MTKTVTFFLYFYIRNALKSTLSEDQTANFRKSSDECDYLIIIDTNGTKLDTIHSGFCSSPSWSPDGQKIAFVYSTADFHYLGYNILSERRFVEISSISRDSLTTVGNLHWSPDGQWLYWSGSKPASSDTYRTNIINCTSEVFKKDCPSNRNGIAAISPDGDKILMGRVDLEVRQPLDTLYATHYLVLTDMDGSKEQMISIK